MSGATNAVATAATPPLSQRRRVLALRVLIVVKVLFVWQIVSVSGWLFRDVVPSLTAIAVWWRICPSIIGPATWPASMA